MRISSVAASASLALVLAFPCAAQQKPAAPAPAAPSEKADPTAPPADAPMDMVAPKMPMPSEGWAANERDEAAGKKASEYLNTVQGAYKAAPYLTDSAKLTMKLPDGEMNDTLEMAFGKGTDTQLKLGGAQIIVVNDTFHLVPDQPADRYLAKKIDGSLGDTVGTVLENFALPAPDFALRHPAKGASPADAFSMGAVKGLMPTGIRTKDGMTQVLLVGGGGEAVVVVDPKTNLVKSFSAVMTPQGLPPSIRIGLEVALSPSLGEPKAPIAFERGTRKAVASLDELSDQGGGAAGGGEESKVKVGADAPLMALQDLDGKTVDLTAMKGKVIVLDFWATWCGPCRKGLPLLHQFAEEMKSNDKVVVYPVNVWENAKGDDLKKKVAEFWAKEKFALKTLMDPEGKLIGQYGFQGIPAFIIVGPDGKLAGTHMGYDPKLVETLKAEVEKALGGKSDAKPAAK